MGLFDKIKNAVVNAATEAKAGYDEAMMLDLETLFAAYKDMKKLDPKTMAYRQAMAEKCRALTEAELEQVYTYIKKQGKFLKQHPAQAVVEDVLVDREMYTRDEDGTISKNHTFRF